MNKIVWILLCYLLNTTLCVAETLPLQSAVPGGIVKIPLFSSELPPPKVYYQQQQVRISKHNGQWLALIGIPLDVGMGEQHIEVENNGHKTEISFSIEDKDYPAQYLTIKKKRMVSGFNEQDLEKIAADKKIITASKAVWTNTNFDLDFIAPVDGRLSSRFGLKRFYNNIPKRPHNGLDIAAPTGTPIIAPASATVINTGDYYFNGKTVFLDHGQGLLSAYLHMNTIQVKTGQQVRQGDMLGTVGESGRVTGPHLHWMVYLNKANVDPALFISKEIKRLDARNRK